MNTSHTTVATANVRFDLQPDQAGLALDVVLDQGPDLVGLQEWAIARAGGLLRHGRVGPVPGVASLGWGRSGPGTVGEYHWNVPLVGGCVVGARLERYTPLRARPVLLSLPGRADRGQGQVVEPGRVATLATYADRVTGRTVTVVSYHLVSGIQRRGRLREDRPVLVARHAHESAVLRRLVRRLLRRGHYVVAVGDSNLDGFTLPGLTSAWAAYDGTAASHGSRRIDDVFGCGTAESVTVVETPSDHRAVVVRRHDPCSDKSR